MSLHLHSRFSASLGGWHVSAFGTMLIIVSCATLGAAMGVLFPMPNLKEISVLFTADTPEPGKVICQFSYHLEKVP
jgi:hypothetical protein